MNRFIPYETIARAEAKDILVVENLPTALGGLKPEQTVAIVELLADAVKRGMDIAFALCDQEPDSPATLMEVFNAGVTEGKNSA